MPSRRYLLAAIAACGLALAGCGGAPPPEPPAPPAAPAPTTIALTATASANVNPDGTGRPSPVVLKVYRLGGSAEFEAADFFQLAESGPATLGASLVGTDELVLAPGETRTLTREVEPNVRFIGVTASYRDIDEAIWRAVVPVTPNAENAIRASAGRLQLTVAPGM